MHTSHFKEDDETRKFVTQPFIIHASRKSETKKLVIEHTKHSGRQVADVLHFKLPVQKGEFNFIATFSFKYITADNSWNQKSMDNDCGSAPHRCPNCNGCFHEDHKCSLLNFVTTNKLKEKQFPDCVEFENNKAAYITLMCAKCNYYKPATHFQKDYVTKHLADKKSNNLRGFSFTSVKPSDFTKETYKKWVAENGGKWVEKDKRFSKAKDAKEKAQFVIVSHNFLQHQKNKPIEGVQFVTWRLLFTLICKEETGTENVDVDAYLLTGKENISFGCAHEIDPLLDGKDGWPPILTSVWERLNEIDPTTAKKQLFDKFVRECKLMIDAMHANNGTIRTFLHALKDNKWFDMQAFKESNDDKPISSYSMTKVEMLMCEHETRIIPSLLKKKVLSCLRNEFSIVNKQKTNYHPKIFLKQLWKQ